MTLLLLSPLRLAAQPANATAGDTEKAQTIVHLLDYVGVDYPEFVKDGQVLDDAEYAEQREFATQAIALLGQLPENAEKAGLLEKARELLARIDAKAAGSDVSALANDIRASVMRAYGLAVAPRQAPDLAKARTLFQAQCVACHGAQGRGDGPLAPGMEPPPSDFHNDARMSVRSIYGLYNTITLGVAGTPMQAYTALSEADRWGLAFLVSSLRGNPDTLAKGEMLWKEGQGAKALGDLKALVLVAPGELAVEGGDDLDALRTYLTAHPEALAALAPAPLDMTRARLDDAVAAYRSGDREAARQHAITAYLEGFELVEAALDNVDAPLRTETERQMMALRAAIAQGEAADAVAARVSRIEGLLDRADERLGAGNLSPVAAFVSALLILLREGLEAILVLAAIIAFVVKTGRRDAMPYIHAGWIAAVVLGVVTWVVSSQLITISGADRETTEGITALLAAAMLLYMGYWLHSKSHANAWQKFVKRQVSASLEKRTLWAMAGVSFLAVYRELFEIVLFYQTLWVQVGPGGRDSLVGGIAAAAALLAVTAWAILKYSVRLPIGPFFAFTSALLAAMAIVFVGNGIAALQEAGTIEATLVDFISIPLLGIHPTVQGLSMQAVAVALVALGLAMSRRQALKGPGT